MVDRADFVATVASYEGTPYHHQGRVPGVGMDCPAPIICAAWEHGLKPRSFDITGYKREPDGTLERLCNEHMDRIGMVDALPGDVVLARFGDGFAQHLGVLVDVSPDRRYWIHAEGYRHKRVMRSRLILDASGHFPLRLVGVYRVEGVT